MTHARGDVDNYYASRNVLDLRRTRVVMHSARRGHPLGPTDTWTTLTITLLAPTKKDLGTFTLVLGGGRFAGDEETRKKLKKYFSHSSLRAGQFFFNRRLCYNIGTLQLRACVCFLRCLVFSTKKIKITIICFPFHFFPFMFLVRGGRITLVNNSL